MKKYGHKKKPFERFSKGFCDPAGVRTQDPNIKSVMLYQLSYRVPQKIEAANIASLFFYATLETEK